ncbi:MAG: amidohydrolase family protein [Cyanobacteria bacterium]|nr:amidohydrolase family protein [Cyanobacteriota bacterium]
MPAKLEIVDFHTHLMSLSGLEQIFPEARKTLFFKHVVPIVEPIADITEPIHDQLLRHLAMHFNNRLARLVFSRFGQLFLMEALRLFKRHGLDRLIHSMDAQGIAHSVIFSLEPLTRTQEIIDQVSAYPGRFSVFAAVERDEPDPVGYLTPFINAGSIKGIKIHPMVGGYQPEELYERTREYVALAAASGLPVALHTGHIPIEDLTGHVVCSQVPVFEPLIKDFPECTFILNHIGWESWRAAISLAQRYSNVMVETSWQPARIIKRAVRQLGAERVLFGSDFPLFQEWQALSEVRKALTDKQFDLVASKNATRILGLQPALYASGV